MKTTQFQDLIQAATGRPLTLVCDSDEIPLAGKIAVMRQGGRWPAFAWVTPKNEDSLLRSFLTAFCSKYREPDPDRYDGDEWLRSYAAKWADPATHDTCAPWGHHGFYMLSKEKLREQVESNFSGFTADMARIGFYPTKYGIGIFTIYGGQGSRDALAAMALHLETHGIPYRNEMSDAGWVTRFVLGLEKPEHAAILGEF